MYANHQFVCARRYSCPCPIRCRVNNMKNTGSKAKTEGGEALQGQICGWMCLCIYMWVLYGWGVGSECMWVFGWEVLGAFKGESVKMRFDKYKRIYAVYVAFAMYV